MRTLLNRRLVLGSVVVAALVAWSEPVLRAAPQPRYVLSPTRVTAQAGGTDTQLTFVLAAPVACPCVVRVENGAGGAPAVGGVADGWVWLDAAPVLSPPAISLTNPVATATVPIAAGAHTLRVRVVGRPGAYVTVSIVGAVPLADLATGRADHTATLVADGSVLLAGGDGPTGATSSVERFDSVTRTVSPAGVLATPRSGAAAIVLPTGELWTTGGLVAGLPTATTELRGGTAPDAIATALAQPLSQHTLTAAADGRLLVLGGLTTTGAATDGQWIDPRPVAAATSLYNIRTATSTVVPGALQVARFGHTATLLPSGLVLVVGGRGASGETASIELFDPSLGASTLLPISLATARSNHSATLLADGSVLVAGGRSGTTLLGTIEVIQAGQNGISTLAARLQTARADHTAALVPGGEVLVAGGRSATGITGHTELIGPPAADSMAPTVVSFEPAPGAMAVARHAVAALRFSEPIDPRSVSPLTVGLVINGTAVVATLAVSHDGLIVFIAPTALLPDNATVSITAAGLVDMAGNSLAPATATFQTDRDVDPGPIPSSVEVFPGAASLGAGGTQTFTATAVYADGMRTDVTAQAAWTAADVATATVNATGVASAAAPGFTSVTARFSGVAGSATVRVYAGEPIPPDPTLVAPPLNRFAPTSFDDSVSFLFEGQNPVQRGVAAGTILPERIAAVRGRVLSTNGTALTGARVEVIGAPAFGYTVTRDDGRFDMAVNGGGTLRLSATLTGHLPSERTVQVAWREFETVADIALVPLDAVVTPVDLAATTPQVARGTVVTDDDGTRQATLLFSPGTVATGVRPDGSTVLLPIINVRATEYTVGPHGPAAMPAPLPPSSAYTYAVEYSVDQALAAGATEVRFSRPVISYTDNFLAFPTGAPVPTAYFNRARGTWVPVRDGRVIAITSETAGGADVDIDGGGADSPAALAAFGITPEEQAQLAVLYDPGQSLWRVAVDHFSPYDMNWPLTLPPGSVNPTSSGPVGGSGAEMDTDDCRPGSIIECQSQSLGEEVPLAGTGLALVYRSSRVPNRRDPYTSTGQLTKATVPASLKRVELVIVVAGRTFVSLHPAQPNQSYTFTWDGFDAYGRPVLGTAPATVDIGYVYDGAYTNPGTGGQTFGQPSRTAMTQDITRGEAILHQTHEVVLGRLTVGAGNSNGWSLSAQHWLDRTSGYLFLGSGGKQSGQTVPAAGTTVAGPQAQGPLSVPAPSTPATSLALTAPNGLVTDAAGNLYFSNGTAGSGYLSDSSWTGNAQATYRVSRTGQVQVVAAGSVGVIKDIGLDGTMYFVDPGRHVVRAQKPDGTVEVRAGVVGTAGYSGDGGPATSARLTRPLDVAVAPDGTLYIADTDNQVVRRVAPDGRVSTYAGTGFTSPGGADMWALDAFLGSVRGVDVGPDGIVYLVFSGASGAFRVTGDGVLRKLPTPASFGGGIRLTDIDATTAGVIVSGASSGGASACTSGVNFMKEGGVAGQMLCHAVGVAVSPDGGINVLVAGTANVERVVRVGVPGTDFVPAGGESVVASADGTEAYVFDAEGRHLRTVDTTTGVAMLTFEYAPTGLLIGIVDRNGKRVTVERQGIHISAIVAPGGERTTLQTDGSGFVRAVTDPAQHTWTFGYSADGLLTSLKRPATPPSIFDYNDERLFQDTDPAGGFTRLDVTRTATGWSTVLTTAEGRTESFLVERLASGLTRRTDTDAAGLRTVTTESPTQRTVVAPDGTQTHVLFTADPRFGTRVQDVQSMTVSFPTTGLQMNVNGTHTATLADRSNIFSVTTESQTFSTSGNRTLSRDYDRALSRLTTSEGGLVSRTTLDTLGRPTAVQAGTSGNVLPVQFSYDSDGRLAEVLQGTRRATIGYDAQHRPTVLTDALQREVRFTYDATGRLLTQTLPDQRVVGFSYDAHGNLTSVTPPSRPAHTFTYTPLDFAASYTPPALVGTGVTGFRYNRDRQVVGIDRPDGLSTGFQYDPGGRLSGVVLGGSGTLTYGYTSGGHVGTVTMPDGQGLTYTYDGFLPLSEQWTGAVSGQVTRSYQVGSSSVTTLQVTSETVSSTPTVTFSYDPAGLITRAGVSVLTRNDLGVPTTVQVGGASGVTETLALNGYGEPETRAARWNTAGAFYTSTYTRDPLGRIATLAEFLDSVTRLTAYTYDPAGRLQHVERDGALVAHYTYDANGNRATTTTSTGVVTSIADAQDRLLTFGATTYTYTANGERRSATTAGQTTTTTYDVLGNLTRVDLPDGRVITYRVDGRGRRVQKLVNGVAVQGWLWLDQLRVGAELDATGAVVSRFVYGSRPNVPDYFVKNGVTYRILADHLGSPRVVIDVASGLVVQRLDNDAFGQVTLDSNPGFQPLGFAGGLYDRDTGLVRFGARDYDARAGVWTTKDPIGLAGGGTALYAYGNGDPVTFRDPNGLWVLNAAGGIYGAISGGVSGYVASGGSFKGAAVGAATGAVIGAINPLSGVVGTFLGGFAQSVFGQVAGNAVTCEASLWDIDFGLAGVSGLGGVAGRTLGAVATAPRRSAFAYEMARRFGSESAAGRNIITGIYEGVGSGAAEAIVASPTLNPSGK